MSENSKTSELTIADNGLVTVSGKLSFSTVTNLIQQAEALFNSEEKRVCFDFEKVVWCDSAGIVLLLRWIQDARRTGKLISFSYLTEQMKRIIEICELGALFSELRSN